MCPRDLAGVLSLEEEGLGLGRGEAENFAVPTNEKTAPAGVDFVTGERVNFDLLLSETALSAAH